jgi:hypothetical protein
MVAAVTGPTCPDATVANMMGRKEASQAAPTYSFDNSPSTPRKENIILAYISS